MGYENAPATRMLAAKVRVVPDSERSPVYQLLRTYYPGALAYGPKGPFTL